MARSLGDTGKEPSVRVRRHLAHRRGLAPRGGRLWPPSHLYKAIGGWKTIELLIDGLYDRIEADDRLRTLFFRDSAEERANQKQFFAEWLGGPTDYDHYKGIRARHHSLRISKRNGGAWLRHFKAAMSDARIANTDAQAILKVIGPVARAFINESGEPEIAAQKLEKRGAIRAAMHHPCVDKWREVARLAAAGDLKAVRKAVADDPELVAPHRGWTHRLLFESARRGRLDVARFLVEQGVDVNAPDDTHTEVMVTPWCIATARKHASLAAYLESAGARRDIFSAAWLGDLDSLEEILANDPDLLDAHDPAQDYMAVLPIHHASSGGQPAAVSYLLKRGSSLGRRPIELIEQALDSEEAPLLAELFAHGADATDLGPGSWVQDPERAAMLVTHGADPNHPAGAWLEFCTGHHGQRDDPDLITALLRAGVDRDAQDEKGRSALHLAAKAGHLETLQVLLDAGCSTRATDQEGTTPLGSAIQSGTSADRLAVVRILLRGGADPNQPDLAGRTPLDLAGRSRRRDAKPLVALLKRHAADR